MDICHTTNLSFFAVSRYHYLKKEICDFRLLPRPHCCMGLVLSGEGCFEFENMSITVRAGDIIFVPVGSCYASYWKGEPDVTYISMHFLFTRPFFLDTKQLAIQKVHIPDVEKMTALFQKAHQANIEQTVGQMQAFGCFFDVMSEVYPLLQRKKAEKAVRDVRMKEAASYLEEHYKEKLKMDDVAKMCHLSPSQFHNRFKAAFGMPPINYRNRIRVRHAMIALVKGGLSVEEISENLGFESAAYFRRVFRKETGCAPTAYAEKAKEI